jgi:hypothetical protein
MGDNTPLPVHSLEFAPHDKYPCVRWLYQIGYAGVDFPEDKLPPGYEKIGSEGNEAANQWIQNRLTAAGVEADGYDFMSSGGKRYIRWRIKL